MGPITDTRALSFVTMNLHLSLDLAICVESMQILGGQAAFDRT